jgi:hypothetical protein
VKPTPSHLIDFNIISPSIFRFSKWFVSAEVFRLDTELSTCCGHGPVLDLETGLFGWLRPAEERLSAGGKLSRTARGLRLSAGARNTEVT